MKIRKILFYFLFTACSFSVKATNYYINIETGNNSNKGTNHTTPWKTVLAVAAIQLQPGDSTLFATGQHFSGMLTLINIKGNLQHPVIVSSYKYKGNNTKPVLDAGQELNAILIQNSSGIKVDGMEITGVVPYQNNSLAKKERMRCGILVEVTQNDVFEDIQLNDVVVHDVYYNAPGFTRSAEETKSANGTQNYGWGIRFINNTKSGQLTRIQVLNTEIFKVCHTGLKFTSRKDAMKEVTVANCKIYQTGGPGMQLSGVSNGHIHHNKIDHSGSTGDSRNWGRGSGLWTWSCSNIVIENNRFENANGPGDSAGIHIDYNCSDVVVQYNLSANNAGGFCEILGNNFNCAFGFEHQVASHLMAEGMTDEALILTRMIHDRYHASKRNPFNEIECSDHYARAMASYGTFITACGFQYHGPKGYIRFAPKWNKENFKAPFTVAEGWGSYSQKNVSSGQEHRLEMKYGSLKLSKLTIDKTDNKKAKMVSVLLGSQTIPSTFQQDASTIQIRLNKPVKIQTNENLIIAIK